MTVVEFLEARLTEDELTAHAATDASPEWQAYYDYRDVKDLDGHFVVQADSHHPTAAQAAHIARHSPARALRECEAKRAIIADFLRRDALLRSAGTLRRSALTAGPRRLTWRASQSAPGANAPTTSDPAVSAGRESWR
jgi:hypothetical protein